MRQKKGRMRIKRKGTVAYFSPNGGAASPSYKTCRPRTRATETHRPDIQEYLENLKNIHK